MILDRCGNCVPNVILIIIFYFYIINWTDAISMNFTGTIVFSSFIHPVSNKSIRLAQRIWQPIALKNASVKLAGLLRVQRNFHAVITQSAPCATECANADATEGTLEMAIHVHVSGLFEGQCHVSWPVWCYCFPRGRRVQTTGHKCNQICKKMSKL